MFQIVFLSKFETGMMDKIRCPHCGSNFDVEEVLSGKVQAHFKKEYENKLAEQTLRLQKEQAKLNIEVDAFEQKKKKENELFQEKLKQQLLKEKETIKKQTLESFEEQIRSLKEENNQRKEDNKKLRTNEVELKRKERELQEKTENLQLDIDKKMLDKQQEIEQKARAKEREEFELEKIKLLKQIEDNKKLAEEMKRKAEQGSMQLQGEVQELALENLLATSYPFDIIKEVPKGVRGADCIQVVRNQRQQECGSIVYESKRTKSFAGDWINKLKQDQMNCKADIAVIVTETYPTGMDRFGLKDGVWICGFHEVKSLSLVLREMIIKTQSVRSMEDNKGDKMELLYKYLTSNEFIHNIEQIVQNYDSMINQLNTEKKIMMKNWATRERQIWTVQENISSLFGNIKGIAGNELDNPSVFELPDHLDE